VPPSRPMPDCLNPPNASGMTSVVNRMYALAGLRLVLMSSGAAAGQRWIRGLEGHPAVHRGIRARSAIESINARLRRAVNARLRRAVNARGHFPAEQAALKCLYLAIMSLDPTGKRRKRWTNRWSSAPVRVMRGQVACGRSRGMEGRGVSRLASPSCCLRELCGAETGPPA
jgi:hypothetical protein